MCTTTTTLEFHKGFVERRKKKNKVPDSPKENKVTNSSVSRLTTETEDFTLQFDHSIVSQSTNCCSLKGTRSSQTYAVSRGTECLSLDMLSPIESLCNGHFSTMNLEIKPRERHLCLDNQHRQETQGSTRATAGTEHVGTPEDTTNNSVS